MKILIFVIQCLANLIGFLENGDALHVVDCSYNYSG